MTPRPSRNPDFICLHCRLFVSADRLLSGVNHRNHCPWCLWSRHLDLYEPGDRLSACLAPMRPVGLAMKPSRNRYAPGGGELLIVHRCEACGAVSLNRIAGDDDSDALRALALLPRPSFPGIRFLAGDDLQAFGPCLFHQKDSYNAHS